MKFIDLYAYLDFCIPVRIQQMYPSKILYDGILPYTPITLAFIEVYLISFDSKENKWVIYYEGDEKE